MANLEKILITNPRYWDDLGAYIDEDKKHSTIKIDYYYFAKEKEGVVYYWGVKIPELEEQTCNEQNRLVSENQTKIEYQNKDFR